MGNRPALGFASQPCDWFAFFENEDAAGPSSFVGGNYPSSERVSKRPETGLAKIDIDHEEEKLSPEEAAASGDCPSNEKGRSNLINVKF
jgi:hypothetical protein